MDDSSMLYGAGGLTVRATVVRFHSGAIDNSFFMLYTTYEPK